MYFVEMHLLQTASLQCVTYLIDRQLSADFYFLFNHIRFQQFYMQKISVHFAVFL